MGEVQKIRRSSAGPTPAAFFPYPRNCWYVAAGRAEITRKPLARKLVDEQVVLFRKENGDVVAMQDRCPHRGYRFSDSKVIGDTIQCGYHGMLFNEQGRCIRIPGPGPVPGVMRVKAFPVVERWHWVWIWLGDPSKADPALIPHAEHEDNESYEHTFHDPMPFFGNVQLAQDNLLDATHATYLHAGELDNEEGGEFTAEPFVSVEDTVIIRIYDMKEYVANETTATLFHVPAGVKLNRRVKVVNHLPCLVNVYTRFYEYQPEFDLQNTGKLVSEHITALAIVPADRNHAYHFTALSSSFKQSPIDKEMLSVVVRQDTTAFASIQEYFEESPETAVEISVQADKLGFISRRIIADMVRKEGGEGGVV
jgi:vanillate O-demethylase monooxygenase subunit